MATTLSQIVAAASLDLPDYGYGTGARLSRGKSHKANKRKKRARKRAQASRRANR